MSALCGLYFSYFEQKVKKLSLYKDDQKKKKNGSTSNLLKMERGIKNVL